MSVQPAAQARTELVDVVARAHRLGFCRRRVAAALEASPRELALIDEQIAADYTGKREELIDVGQLITGLHGRSTGIPW